MAARKNKGDIKLNKVHNGKEFSSAFHFVGLVKPVRKKEEDSDNWYDVEIFDTNKTSTNKDRRVLQFNIETAFKNELKVELAGMEMPQANAYSSKHKHNFKVDWDNRFDKSLYPDDTYHLIDPDWDKAEKLGKQIKAGMWVEVKGHYEFSSFTNDEGTEINLTKRVIDQVFPLKNGEVEITGLKDGETFKAYDSRENGQYLGMGKAKEGVATIKVGWLNPEGGKLYVCKVESDESEGKRTELEYSEGTVQVNDRIKVSNNVQSSIRLPKRNGQPGFEFVPYVRDFKSEDFKEINGFEMQLGIRSTYQDETTKDTKVNGVFLDYGKTKSVPRDVELVVYYNEAEEGKTALADAFSRLNKLDFFVVEGVDNNRAEFAMIEVQETEEDDNPFDDVGEKVSDFEQATTGTKKGLEILRYVSGTYKKEFLIEEEISKEEPSNGDPFESVSISDDDLPF